MALTGLNTLPVLQTYRMATKIRYQCITGCWEQGTYIPEEAGLSEGIHFGLSLMYSFYLLTQTRPEVYSFDKPEKKEGSRGFWRVLIE